MDHPSKAMWWTTQTRTCSSSRSPRSASRSSGPRSRSKGRRASRSIRRRASASRWGSGRPVRSIRGTRGAPSGRITWTGWPSTTPNVVRRISWRRTISATHRSTTPASSDPVSRTAAARL
ncbi:hypothetical protein BE20_29645 [Sorangium cellulosum]|nr:hypothetical protein BE20_29645 [Sorangium cellulosum]